MHRVHLAGLVAALVMLPGCSGRGGVDSASEGSAPVDAAAVAGAMCDAAQAADGGDLDAARAAFEDEHLQLHALAEATARTDRERAGELLRTKEVVEAGLREAPAARLAHDLRALAGAAARAAGANPPPCQ